MKRPTHRLPSGSPRAALFGVLATSLGLAGCADRTPTPTRDASTAVDLVTQDLIAEIAQQAPDGGPDAPATEAGADVPTDEPANPDGGVPDGGEADKPSSTDGAAPDATCVASTAFCASATVSHACNAQGTSERDIECPLGCMMDGPRTGSCREVTPSNGFPGFTCGDDRFSPVSLDIREDAELDPDHGAYSTVTSTILAPPAFVTALQGGAAPSVGVFHLAHLTIDEGQTLTVRRGATGAVVFLVDGDVEINGTLDVGAKGALSGAGASSLGAGVLATSVSGSGGGSFGTPGSAGGASSTTPGAVAGALYGNASLVPLFGGSPGGGATFSGGGGGALQISACGRVRIGPHGVIRAAGGAAQANRATVPGAGGGAGGGVLIEALRIILQGAIAANGGSGAGASSDTVAGTEGADGLLSDQPALPGTNGTGEKAGAGSCASMPATPAQDAATGPSGGGGGGLGRIRFATMDFIQGSTPLTLTGSASPAPSLDVWPTR